MPSDTTKPQGATPNPSQSLSTRTEPESNLTNENTSEPSELATKPKPNADNNTDEQADKIDDSKTDDKTDDNEHLADLTDLSTKRPFSTARMYRAAGWTGTLPLPERKKSPPPKGYTGAGRDNPTDKQVEAWLRENPTGNIGLRLAEVPHKHLPPGLPSVYAKQQVVGWELIGIDVDDYKNKNGGKQRADLEAELGDLPATALSSARWGKGGASCIAIYLVPKGYRFMGKAKDCIDIVQKRHRYMVAWPSVNPDAVGPNGGKAVYEWRIGKPSNVGRFTPPGSSGSAGSRERADAAAANGGVGLTRVANGIPALTDVAVMPEAWFTYLSRGGENETDDPISDLDDGALIEWAQSQLRWGNGELDCPEYPPCRFMRRQVAKQIEKLNESAESHPKLNAAVWEILQLGANPVDGGHRGIHWGLAEYISAWREHAKAERGGDDPNALSAEIGRSVRNALSKLEPLVKSLPEEPCDKYDAARKLAAESYAAGNGLAKKLAAHEHSDECGDECEEGDHNSDYGGLGPVIGPMEVLPAEPAHEYTQNDVGNAKHLLDLYGANIKYVGGRNNWVIWDGRRWHNDDGDLLMGHAYSRVRLRQEAAAEALFLAALEAEATDAPEARMLKATAKSWRTWAKTSGESGRIKSSLHVARWMYIGDEPVVMKASEFDSKQDLLGCANGVLELSPKDGDEPFVRPARKEDYVTFNTNVPYVPWDRLTNSPNDDDLEAMSLWAQYLTTFLPDESVRRYVQKVLGHMLIGGNPEKLMVFLYGTHDTGKSTMLNAINGALGDYFGTVDLSLFKQKDLNPGLIQACPRRVVGMSEVDSGRMDVATIKRLTGNDPVRAEAKYSNEIFEGRPQFTIVISCNNPPSIDHADEALNERLMVLPFNESISRDNRDYSAADNIEKYCGVAVLSWLVEGWVTYCREGLGKRPKAIDRVQQEMFNGLNDTRSFISECLEFARDTEDGMRAEREAREKSFGGPMAVSNWDPEWTPVAANVYQLYVNWCTANRVTPITHPALTKELGVGRPVTRRVNGKNHRCYVGLRIK